MDTERTARYPFVARTYVRAIIALVKLTGDRLAWSPGVGSKRLQGGNDE